MFCSTFQNIQVRLSYYKVELNFQCLLLLLLLSRMYVDVRAYTLNRPTEYTELVLVCCLYALWSVLVKETHIRIRDPAKITLSNWVSNWINPNWMQWWKISALQTDLGRQIFPWFSWLPCWKTDSSWFYSRYLYSQSCLKLSVKVHSKNTFKVRWLLNTSQFTTKINVEGYIKYYPLKADDYLTEVITYTGLTLIALSSLLIYKI